MDDLISRQAAIEALEREKTYARAYREGYTPVDPFKQYNAGLADGVKAIMDLPSVERKKGIWLEPEDDEDRILISAKCSSCEWEAIIGETDVAGMPFCPNCGADMRGEEHE